MSGFAQALAGGALIGAAAALLMALEGRVAGISGILGGLLRPAPTTDRAWRVTFLAGLVVGPALRPPVYTLAQEGPISSIA